MVAGCLFGSCGLLADVARMMRVWGLEVGLLGVFFNGGMVLVRRMLV